MNKPCRFFILLAMALALVLPSGRSRIVHASDFYDPFSPGQTYRQRYYILRDAEVKYTDPSLIDLISENPDVLYLTDVRANDAEGTGKERFFQINYTINTKASGDARIDLYYDGKLVQKDLLEEKIRNVMWRLYNPNSGEHFYTSSQKESAHLYELGWKDEDIAWYGVK